MSEQDKCPGCGSPIERYRIRSSGQRVGVYGCGVDVGPNVVLPECLRRQLAAMTTRVKELEEREAAWHNLAGDWLMRCEKAEAERDRLKVIVDKLSTTADGVPAYKDMPVWCKMPNGTIYETGLEWYCAYGAVFAHALVGHAGYRMPNGVWIDKWIAVEDSYSTHEAAQAAKEKDDAKP